MATQSKSCKYLARIRYVVDEIGGGITPTVMPEQWKCKLDLEHSGMPWDKCRQTSFEGPCWQMASEFKTTQEWDVWVRQRLLELGLV